MVNWNSGIMQYSQSKDPEDETSFFGSSFFAWLLHNRGARSRSVTWDGSCRISVPLCTKNLPQRVYHGFVGIHPFTYPIEPLAVDVEESNPVEVGSAVWGLIGTVQQDSVVLARN